MQVRGFRALRVAPQVVHSAGMPPHHTTSIDPPERFRCNPPDDRVAGGATTGVAAAGGSRDNP